MAGKTFKLIVFRLLESAFASQKFKMDTFTNVPQAKLETLPRFFSSTPGRKKVLIPPTKFFLKSISSRKKEGGDYGCKIQLQGSDKPQKL